MDALDRRILRELQRDCTPSAVELAERCGTTESTALRRIKQMRSDGTIRSQVAVVDAQRVGRGLQLFVRVRLEREGKEDARQFIEQVSACHDVIQFFFVTGSSDYFIMLAVRTMEDYDRFVQDYLLSNPLAVLSDTSVVIRPIKWSLEIPIDDA